MVSGLLDASIATADSRSHTEPSKSDPEEIEQKRAVLPPPPDPDQHLPLTIQDLLSTKGHLRLESRITFSTSEQENIESLFEVIKTGDGRFISIPVATGSTRKTSDIFVVSIGGRYGLTKDTELVMHGLAVASDIRTVDMTGNRKSAGEQQFNALTVGLNHRFSDDNETPAFLGFTEINALENTAAKGHDFTYGRTGILGFTTYRVIDPLVLSLTGGYRMALAARLVICKAPFPV